MDTVATGIRLRGRLIDSLYTEAMLLADEARAYFDQGGRTDREQLAPLARVTLSCESLKVTTRLMCVLSWLLTQRAVELGQIGADEGGSSSDWNDQIAEADSASWAGLPTAAIALIEASHDLYARVRRLDAESSSEEPVQSPALGLLSRLERAF